MQQAPADGFNTAPLTVQLVKVNIEFGRRAAFINQCQQDILSFSGASGNNEGTVYICHVFGQLGNREGRAGGRIGFGDEREKRVIVRSIRCRSRQPGQVFLVALASQVFFTSHRSPRLSICKLMYFGQVSGHVFADIAHSHFSESF